MPNYQTSGLITSLYPGDPPAYAFNAESPTPPQASQQFAVGLPWDSARAGAFEVAWQTSFATAPTSVIVYLQAADIDADANYAIIDTSTATDGERRTVATKARFLRAKLKVQSAGGAITVTISI